MDSIGGWAFVVTVWYVLFHGNPDMYDMIMMLLQSNVGVGW